MSDTQKRRVVKSDWELGKEREIEQLRKGVERAITKIIEFEHSLNREEKYCDLDKEERVRYKRLKFVLEFQVTKIAKVVGNYLDKLGGVTKTLNREDWKRKYRELQERREKGGEERGSLEREASETWRKEKEGGGFKDSKKGDGFG